MLSHARPWLLIVLAAQACVKQDSTTASSGASSVTVSYDTCNLYYVYEYLGVGGACTDVAVTEPGKYPTIGHFSPYFLWPLPTAAARHVFSNMRGGPWLLW
jgi:hypothetical protein